MFAMLSGAWPRLTPDGTPIDDLAGVEADAAVERLVGDLVAAQEATGIGLVRDGDVRWRDPVAMVLAAVAAGEMGEEGPLVRAWRATSALTTLPVAQTVPGPWTLAVLDVGGWGDPGVVTGRAAELAGILADEIGALAAAGCPVIQVVEPAAVMVGEDPALQSGFLRAQRRLLAKAPDAHAMLAITGGSAHRSGPGPIFGAPYRSYLFDLVAGPDNWYLVRSAPGDRGIVCAALRAGDARGSEDQAPLLSWAAHYAASSNGRGLERVGLANATPLAGLDPTMAHRALDDLGRAAVLAAVPPKKAVDLGMDPRSIVAKAGGTAR
jgi:hypothetical protein